MDRLLLPGQCQYNGCTHCVNPNGSGKLCFTHGGWHVCSHASCSKTLLKLEDSASNMATRSQLAAWMDAVIRALRVDFAKDMEPTVVAMSSIVRITYLGTMCADFIII